MAVYRNIDLRVEALNFKMAETDTAKSWGIYNPVLNATGTGGVTGTPGDPFFSSRTWNASIGLTQNLPTGGSIGATTQTGYFKANPSSPGELSNTGASSTGHRHQRPRAGHVELAIYGRPHPYRAVVEECRPGNGGTEHHPGSQHPAGFPRTVSRHHHGDGFQCHHRLQPPLCPAAGPGNASGGPDLGPEAPGRDQEKGGGGTCRRDGACKRGICHCPTPQRSGRGFPQRQGSGGESPLPDRAGFADPDHSKRSPFQGRTAGNG